MNLLEGMKKNNIVINSKGSLYYHETYDYNLDLFTMASRYNSDDELINLFNNAFNEDEDLALANLLYILDIRNGKGERRIFKIIFKYLCNNYASSALKVLPLIGILGRYDYILEGIDTKINDQVIDLIKKQLFDDIKSEAPSLMAKWLPSHRSHKVNNLLAKKIMHGLDITEKEYRLTLAKLRKKINIVERNLTFRSYNNIDFNYVPSKAMLKYANVFNNKIHDRYQQYKSDVKRGIGKINTKGLLSYEIVKKILFKKDIDDTLLDLMWNNQKDVFKDCTTNVLVMADTSGSMMSYGGIPYATSIGLALYTAERNHGIFKNHFITFSDQPYLCEVKGNTIKEKVHNIPCYIASTNIDSAFELILNTAIENNLKEEVLPSHLLIISDMEFDTGVYSKNGTNFNCWKKAFNDKGYALPKIIFYNVAGKVNGVPVCKFDCDVAMVSGFSTNILDQLLTLENYSPNEIMLEKLSVYLNILKN